MKIKIKRQDEPKSAPYFQTFNYEKMDKVTVAAILDDLNFADDLFDENGNPCRRIRWNCSCMQKMCGACAMVVNGEPVLACNRFVDPKETKELVVEPLTKFPVITDLCVDRTVILESLKNAGVFIGKVQKPDEKEFKYQYAVSKCLKCGLCLEACPNYAGRSEASDNESGMDEKTGDIRENYFHGALFANESYLMHSQSENRKDELKASYKKHFENGCSKSLACRSVCPMKIPTLASIGYMNRT